ncbi:HAD family hydrolase [Longitalea luteola]|uniref:HAD family hydrolase n=1 Tax=Longitalea luteola TaxID=2812563 RepID=UPI001A96F112|nr:HAD family hydrolase [Longitalea luteola]
MKKRAIIFDLDNTIFPVPQIGHQLFAPLFALIEQEGSQAENLPNIKDEVMRRPFQQVAKDYHFNEALTSQSLAILKGLAYEGSIEPFEDYALVKQLPIDKFLVTTGFKKMQQSKIDRMQLQKDFKEIHIIDPSTTSQVKKDVFAEIQHRYGFAPEEMLVVGDDLHSEIKAAQELGFDAIWYDKYRRYEEKTGVKKIADFRELLALLQ